MAVKHYQAIMSFTYKKRKGKEYLYFQGGTKGTFYLLAKENPSNVNVENVKRSLDYVLKRIEKDHKIVTRLVSYLPSNLRKKYIDQIRKAANDSLGYVPAK